MWGGPGCTCIDSLCFSYLVARVQTDVLVAEMPLVPGTLASPANFCSFGCSEDQEITAPSRAFLCPFAAPQRLAQSGCLIRDCELNSLGVFSLQRHLRPETISSIHSLFCPFTRSLGQTFLVLGAFKGRRRNVQ